MIAGKWYDAADAELCELRAYAHSRTEEFNRTTGEDAEKRRLILAELLGGIGEGSSILPTVSSITAATPTLAAAALSTSTLFFWIVHRSASATMFLSARAFSSLLPLTRCWHGSATCTPAKTAPCMKLRQPNPSRSRITSGWAAG
ncbi:MAG: maltose acetyltransferase domain-containing protein [Hydrogeniiclostridium mannosilyticum]